MLKYNLPASSRTRVPRPMICLNSVIELITRTSTMFLHVGASIPVVSNCDVVRITGVARRDSAMDTVWREKSVFDPLAQRVSVDRIAKVGVGVRIVRALRRCGHAELVGRLEVAEDLAPVALVVSAAAMALIDNDQIE